MSTGQKISSLRKCKGISQEMLAEESRVSLFQARFCFSTPFWRQDNILGLKVEEFLTSKETLNTFVYLSAGTNETENIKNGLDNMIKIFQDKASAGIVWYADYTPGADHQDNSQLSAPRAIGAWANYLKTLKPWSRMFPGTLRIHFASGLLGLEKRSVNFWEITFLFAS